MNNEENNGRIQRFAEAIIFILRNLEIVPRTSKEIKQLIQDTYNIPSDWYGYKTKQGENEAPTIIKNIDVAVNFLKNGHYNTAGEPYLETVGSGMVITEYGISSDFGRVKPDLSKEYLIKSLEQYTNNKRPDFSWVSFFSEFADKIYASKDDFKKFSESIKEIADKVLPKRKDGKERAMPTYINPFSAFALINRSIKIETRKSLCRAYKDKFEIEADIPNAFDGVPVANNVNWWFILEHSAKDVRLPDNMVLGDTKKIWDIFTVMYEYFRLGKRTETEFINAFDQLKEIRQIGLTYVTISLFWMDPEKFLPLDSNTTSYLSAKVDLPRPIQNYFRSSDKKRKLSKVGKSYLDFIKELKSNEDTDDFKLISYNAWKKSSETEEKGDVIALKDWNELFSKGIIVNDVKTIIDCVAEQEESNTSISEVEILTSLVNVEKILDECGRKVRQYLSETKLKTWSGCAFFNSKVNEEDRFLSISESLAEYLSGVEMQTIHGGNVKKSDKYHPNIILYGPPGTGKTHNTRKMAVNIIENRDCTNDEVNELYNNYLEKGQIGFVTFHQSQSYEQFIEGITAVSDDNQPDLIQYRVEPGVFKQFCDNAASTGSYSIPDNPVVWKVSLQSTGENELREHCLNNECIRIGWCEYGEMIDDFSQLKEGKRELTNFYEMKKGDYVLSCFSNTTIDAVGVVDDDYPMWDVGKDNKFDHYPRIRAVHWIKKFPQEKKNIYKLNGNKVMAPSTVYHLRNITKNSLSEILNDDIKPNKNENKHVFIIDEINRGNISRIFGELITLIEDTKRKGCDEELSAILPYSKEPFSVPQNVYIIGTMNTADRSLVALDTALRRRFLFEEMMPDYKVIEEYVTVEAVEGVNVSELMAVINRRIVALYDREHQLGHSYFIHIKNLEDLKEVFLNKVIPMLQEYFHEDYQKIAYVLSSANNVDESKFITKVDLNEGKFVFSKYGKQPFCDMTTYNVITKDGMKALTAQDFIDLYTVKEELDDKEIDT